MRRRPVGIILLHGAVPNGDLRCLIGFCSPITARDGVPVQLSILAELFQLYRLRERRRAVPALDRLKQVRFVLSRPGTRVRPQVKSMRRLSTIS